MHAFRRNFDEISKSWWNFDFFKVLPKPWNFKVSSNFEKYIKTLKKFAVFWLKDGAPTKTVNGSWFNKNTKDWTSKWSSSLKSDSAFHHIVALNLWREVETETLKLKQWNWHIVTCEGICIIRSKHFLCPTMLWRRCRFPAQGMAMKNWPWALEAGPIANLKYDDLWLEFLMANRKDDREPWSAGRKMNWKREIELNECQCKSINRMFCILEIWP